MSSHQSHRRASPPPPFYSDEEMQKMVNEKFAEAEVRPRYHISDYDDDDNYFYGARGYYPLDVFQRTGKFEKEPVFGHSDHLQLKYKDYDKGWFDLRELESVDARKNALLKRRTITARGLAL